jgi:hypothetical protein
MTSLCVINANGTNQNLLVNFFYLGAYDPDWGGKPTNTTSVGSNVSVKSGSTTVTFNTVTSSGVTEVNPISPTSVQPLPSGYSTIAGAGLAYSITTTANVTAPITSCFVVSTVNDPVVFNSLRILHAENGVLVDRTILPPDILAPRFATRTICSRTSSLSPFIVAQKIDQSLPSISGVVVDGNDDPVSDVTIQLSGDRSVATVTDINGQFVFPNLSVGSNYSVTPVSEGVFSFAPQDKSYLNLQFDQADVFSAASCSFNLGSQSANFTSAGGSSSFNIIANPAGCSWSAIPGESWVAITSSVTGSNTASIQFTVGANSGGARSSTITVGGQMFQITEGAATAAGTFESDMSPRSSGDGAVLSTDINLIRQFVVGLLTPDPTTNEFQRADAAPFASRGDGLLTAGDIIQARRYAVGLDLLQTAAGPLGPAQTRIADPNVSHDDNERSGTSVKIMPSTGITGGKVTVPINLVAPSGSVSAASFTLHFDSRVLTNPTVSSTDLSNGSVVTINNKKQNKGELTILIDSDKSLVTDEDKPLVLITFDVAADARPGRTKVTFGTSAGGSAIADQYGDLLPAYFSGGLLTISSGPAAIGRNGDVK